MDLENANVFANYILLEANRFAVRTATFVAGCSSHEVRRAQSGHPQAEHEGGGREDGERRSAAESAAGCVLKYCDLKRSVLKYFGSAWAWAWAWGSGPQVLWVRMGHGTVAYALSSSIALCRALSSSMFGRHGSKKLCPQVWSGF